MVFFDVLFSIIGSLSVVYSKFHGIPSVVLVVAYSETLLAYVLLQLFATCGFGNLVVGVHVLIHIEMPAEDFC